MVVDKMNSVFVDIIPLNPPFSKGDMGDLVGKTLSADRQVVCHLNDSLIIKNLLYG